MTDKGKPSSKLNEETILFVFYKDVLYQCNLSQSSKWSFKDYSKKINPSSVLTSIGSIEETNGSNTYRKMTFANKRLINSDEFEMVKAAQDGIKETVESDAAYFLKQANQPLQIETDKDKELDDLVADAAKAL